MALSGFTLQQYQNQQRAGTQPVQPTSMFNFQPKQQVEDKNISSDEARQLFTGKPREERKMIYEKLKSE